MLVLVLLAGFGCSSSQQTTIESGAGIQSTAESIDELLRLAQSRSGFEASALSIQAMELMLDDGQSTRAGLIAAQLPEPESLPGSYQFRYALVRAEIAL